MKNKKLIFGNWKMNPKSVLEARKLFEAVRKEVAKLKNTEVAACVPAVFLGDLANRVAKGKCALGAQNVYFEPEGAFTGEISAPMLASLGVKYVIVGHSERRAMGETDTDIGKKVAAAWKSGLAVILCIGERVRDPDGGYLQGLREQIAGSLSGVSKRMLPNIVIAYEPVWAIGENATGVISPADLFEMVIFIRKVLADLFGQKQAHAMPILYGGSVDETNAGSFMSEGGANGLLVGRASTDAKKFAAIIKIAEKI